MRILLILPYDGPARGPFKRSISYAPLTLTTLAALVPAELGARVDILDEGVSSPGKYAQNRYDIVGVSGTTSASSRAYALCAFWKQRGAHTVMGGPHATLMPEEALEHADTVCVGLGESTWPQFLREYAAGQPGRVYRHIFAEGDCPMPVPRRDLLPAGTYMSMTTVLANRGCANACEFCSLTAQWGRRGLTRPLKEVVDEIRTLVDSFGKRSFIFLDPSMYSNRDYACRLFEALLPLRITWHGLATLDMADDAEFLDLAAQSGCAGILAGLETLDARTMPDINKRMNTPRRYKEQIAALQKKGIAVLGCFVLGFDNDTEEGLRSSIGEILELGLDVPRFAVLTPFPGTGLFKRLEREGRILTRDWARYDTEQVVFQPAHMTPQALQSMLQEAWKRAYSLPQIVRRTLSRPEQRLQRLAVNIGFRFNAGKLAERRQ